MRRAFPIALLLLVSCTGGEASPGAPADPSASPSASARPEPFFEPEQVRMFAGLDGEVGVLAVTCEDGSCRAVAPARPKRYIDGVPSGLVSFTTAKAPKTARLEVRRAGRPSREEPEATIELQPKTLMSTVVTLAKGRYVLTFVEGWRDREARWIFGMNGPSGR
jgi:hypothetical protein